MKPLHVLGGSIGIALAAVTSCVLPSYSVGGTTSGGAAGGATTSGPGTGGAAQSSSSGGGVVVGSGGAGLGGSGIGGDLASCDADTLGREQIAPADTPHGITLSTNYVYWIAADTRAYAAARMAPHAPTPFAPSSVCGLAGSTFQNEDKVLLRTTDGTIYVASPGGSLTPLFSGGAPLSGGACAISLTSNGQDLYGFEPDQKGAYAVVKYTLSNPTPMPFASTMGTPIAIDATNESDVAWVEAFHGAGLFNAYAKASGTVDFSQGGGWTDACAYGKPGTFAFADPSTAIIDTWSQADGPGSFASNVHANWLACNASYRAWIDYGDGCATLWHQQKQFGVATVIAKNQPRACSIAIAGATVFWTNCEPSGGVYKTKIP